MLQSLKYSQTGDTFNFLCSFLCDDKNEPKNVPRGFRFLSDSPKQRKGQALWKPEEPGLNKRQKIWSEKMIILYEKNETDFTHNGWMILQPI